MKNILDNFLETLDLTHICDKGPKILQNKTCLKLRRKRREMWGRGTVWRNDPNNVCTCE
jgi:hypothetical protein